MPDRPEVGASDALAPRPPGTDCPSCASARAQNRNLCDLLVQEADALHAVREYALECSSRAGAQIDAATVAASLWTLISGVPIPVRPCPVCVERRIYEARRADMLLGLADLQRAGGA